MMTHRVVSRPPYRPSNRAKGCEGGISFTTYVQQERHKCKGQRCESGRASSEPEAQTRRSPNQTPPQATQHRRRVGRVQGTSSFFSETEMPDPISEINTVGGRATSNHHGHKRPRRANLKVAYASIHTRRSCRQDETHARYQQESNVLFKAAHFLRSLASLEFAITNAP